MNLPFLSNTRPFLHVLLTQLSLAAAYYMGWVWWWKIGRDGSLISNWRMAASVTEQEAWPLSQWQIQVQAPTWLNGHVCRWCITPNLLPVLNKWLLVHMTTYMLYVNLFTTLFVLKVPATVPIGKYWTVFAEEVLKF